MYENEIALLSLSLIFPKFPICITDNDPKHTSRVAKAYFERARYNILPWPAMSPDLNPIENVWKTLKERVQARNPTSKTQGWQFCQEEWPKIAKEYYAHLVYSMPRRCQAVLDAKGHATKY